MDDIQKVPKKKRGNPAIVAGGPSLNPAGRPVGCKNKTTRTIEAVIQTMLDASQHDLVDAATLAMWRKRPADMARFIASVAPKDLRLGGIPGGAPVRVDMSKLTDDELVELQRLKDKVMLAGDDGK